MEWQKRGISKNWITNLKAQFDKSEKNMNTLENKL